MFTWLACMDYPPAPRCGDSDQGIYVGEWMVPRCYGIDDSEKGVLVTNKLVSGWAFFEVFEKTRCLSRLPHSYFLYVAVARWVTKLFRIEEELRKSREIQLGGNSFRKIRYVFRKISIFYENHSIWGRESRFWGPKVCICMKNAVRIHLDTSRDLKPS